MDKLSRILQININHSAGAHDLLLQTLAEWKVGLVIVYELYKTTDSSNWVTNPANTVAIYRNASVASPPLRAITSGHGYVVVEWGNVCITGVYAPPSWPIEKFCKMLKEIDRQTQRSPKQKNIIIAGNFDAKTVSWGSRNTNLRGKIFLEWSAERDIYLLNDQGISTCLRWLGESVVDLA